MAGLKTLTVNGKTYKVAPIIPSSGVTLLAEGWVENEGSYSQIVELAGVTSHTKVDLQPTPDQDEIFRAKTLAFVAENDDGVVTVFSVGDRPRNDYTIQVTMTEVEGEGKIRGNTVGVPNPQADWNQTDPTKADYIKNKPDAAGIGARPNTWLPTIAEIGAAPAGYGLGANMYVNGPIVSNFDDAKKTGWYACFNLGIAIDTHVMQSGMLEVISYIENRTKQIFYPSASNEVLERWRHDGEWQPWEWVNPPMRAGVEYRTMERFADKPVYVQFVYFGGISAGATNKWDISDRNIADSLDISLINQVGALINGHPGVTSYKFEPTFVEIVTSGVVGTSVYATLKYTKK